jgi:hypothetical protein
MTSIFSPKTLQQVALRATEGPWVWERRKGTSSATIRSLAPGRIVTSVARMGRKDLTEEVRQQHLDNAEFIATFDPPMVLALLKFVNEAWSFYHTGDRASFVRAMKELNTHVDNARKERVGP